MFGKSIEEGKKDSQVESLEINEEEKLSQDILEEVKNNNVEEDKSLKEVESRIDESNQNFQKESGESGFISGLSEKIKKNKFLRASLVAYSLYSASPVLAVEIPKLLEGNQDVVAQQSVNKSKLEQFGNMPEEYREQLERVFSEASDEKKKIIREALENDSGLNEEEIINSKEDINKLKLQQQIIDLQNSGEMKGEQKITINNAGENQIRVWIDFLKDSEKAKEKARDFEEKNKEGWQNVYPERNLVGHEAKKWDEENNIQWENKK